MIFSKECGARVIFSFTIRHKCQLYSSIAIGQKAPFKVKAIFSANDAIVYN